ncbi:uncharacterized protein LOC142323319 isoform X2 [Lycorma delicatula]|uniref:uncharacterized protein LOC142323319 isoform X2 n=1 Tax=Lycorma delicatula TaxID=130591 RepID=UPI003F51233B
MFLDARYRHPLTLFAVIHCLQQAILCDGACFFPTELQGEFIMQSIYMADSQVQYSQVNITADAIPIWGLCHRRIGNNVILIDSFNGANCIRCFQLTLKSRNVLQVKTEGLDKCYTSEDVAEATCPQENNSDSDSLKEILLYKTKELGGEEIRKEYCPIHGKFSFTYNINDGSENKIECDNQVSQIETCSSPLPTSSLNLHFRSCSFSDHDITFVCLGDWQGPGNQRYLALHDTRITSQNRPQYRCAMYNTDPATGNINIAFSSDSTCSTNLVNSTSGYETLVLKSLPEPSWPPKVAASLSRFPQWTQGNWEHMSIDGNTITYRDHSRYQTLKIRSVGPENASGERFPIYIRDECGGESYSCIWLQKRGMNVLEFQLGLNPSAVYNDTLCFDSNFQSKVWITQGRLERLQESPCPITGEYTGFIPDAMGLCAKLSSDCKSPEIMYYTLSDCAQKDIYEEREYRCLGQWVENGVTYTYTQRKDIGIYECFVGSIVSNNEIYIKEAGEHCERDVDPLHLGMKLSRIAPPRIKNEVLNSGERNASFWLTMWSSCFLSLVLKFLVYNNNYNVL